jgi:hypothetical protein
MQSSSALQHAQKLAARAASIQATTKTDISIITGTLIELKGAINNMCTTYVNQKLKRVRTSASTSMSVLRERFDALRRDD